MNKRIFLRFINFYPPFLGAGIRVSYDRITFRSFKTKLKRRFWNQNYMGTHFGGSLYLMCDPFFVLILIENLGEDYIVWDISSKINFIKATGNEIEAEFSVSSDEIDSIKQDLEIKKKITRTYHTEIIDVMNKAVIASVEKTIYIRKAGRLKSRLVKSMQ
ncbi:MAG: DUF4442 domain-containing protein [Spirochaetia bacterium]|nr:DUF4442 domain-containing protein [Spirochaetia bacterium]